MMRDQDEVDGDSLARPEDSAQKEEDVEEKEPAPGEDEDFYVHGYPDRMVELLRSDKLPPTIDLVSVFGKTAIRSLDKEKFQSRLKYFLRTEGPKIPPLGSDLVNFLFNQAVDAHKNIAVWDFIVKDKKKKLDKPRQYLREELSRYVKIRSLLRATRQFTPSWIYGWAYYWIGAFEEMQELIEAQLRIAIKDADRISKQSASGRFEMRSYILWVEKEKIRKQIARTPVARKLEAILAAFAYAAELVTEPTSGIEGYVALIKQRVSRVSRSTKRQSEGMLSSLKTSLQRCEDESGSDGGS